MLSAQDEQFVQRVVRRNACVLFLGAGFSSDAISPTGLPLPGGETLGNAFWQWLGYDKEHGAYDPGTSPLDKLFDVARKRRGDRAVLAFLKESLLVREYPDWYRTVAYPYWFRVYTTNVDNLVEMVDDDTGTAALEVRNAIIHRYSERDQTLAKLQYIKLNGSIADFDDIELVTFGARQYGARAADYDPWYDHFVRDYATHATILVGSQMSEPLFWRALVSRQGRSGAASELRLRSFLVCPHISPVVLDSLADFNVVAIQATAGDFFKYLHSVIGGYPAYEDILVHVNPQLAQDRDVLTGDKRDVEAIKVYLAAFARVAVPEKPGGYRSLFLLGAAPTWDDIALGLDAQREVTAQAQQLIETSVSTSTSGKALTVITGHRGCGKSTLLMRVAVNLAAAGHLVFHAWGEDVPEPHVLSRAIERLGNRPILMIDDAEWLGGTLPAHVSELSKLKNAPVLVVAMRANV